MSSAVNVFVHAIRKRYKKCLAQKVGHLGSLGLIPMIQPPFCSFVLLYHLSLERSFFIEQFSSYTLLNFVQKFDFNV